MPTETNTRERVKQMDAAGLKPREIAAALGISTQAVWLHRDALGLTPKAQKAKEQAS